MVRDFFCRWNYFYHYWILNFEFSYVLLSFNPNIIVLCNYHFVNHENIVLWLYYQRGYQFLNSLNSLNSLNCSEIFLVLEIYLKKVTFSHWFLSCSWILIFWQNFVPTESGKPKRLRENYLYSFNQGKIDNNLNQQLTINN